MQITQIHCPAGIAVSFEFFPPKTEQGWELLFQTVSRLIPLRPSFVSVTYGAGGSTRSRTHDIVVRIQRDTDMPVVAHLTCVGSNRTAIGDILTDYSNAGIRNILALRGDVPSGMSESASISEGRFPPGCRAGAVHQGGIS